jgi:hypothetical protein
MQGFKYRRAMKQQKRRTKRVNSCSQFPDHEGQQASRSDADTEEQKTVEDPSGSHTEEGSIER